MCTRHDAPKAQKVFTSNRPKNSTVHADPIMCHRMAIMHAPSCCAPRPRAAPSLRPQPPRLPTARLPAPRPPPAPCRPAPLPGLHTHLPFICHAGLRDCIAHSACAGSAHRMHLMQGHVCIMRLRGLCQIGLAWWPPGRPLQAHRRCLPRLTANHNATACRKTITHACVCYTMRGGCHPHHAMTHVCAAEAYTREAAQDSADAQS